MKHEIYIFGSACRGDVTSTSDVDVLAIPFDEDRSNYPPTWSVYTPKTIQEYYCTGRLFAWHLHLESKCIYTLNAKSFLSDLGNPKPYATMNKDIDELESLLQQAICELKSGTKNIVFEFGIVYTAIRDIAMSASWSLMKKPCFSSDAPYKLPIPCPVDYGVYKLAQLARHSSTRGIEVDTSLDVAVNEILRAPIEPWINSLRGENEKYISKQSVC